MPCMWRYWSINKTRPSCILLLQHSIAHACLCTIANCSQAARHPSTSFSLSQGSRSSFAVQLNTLLQSHAALSDCMPISIAHPFSDVSRRRQTRSVSGSIKASREAHVPRDRVVRGRKRAAAALAVQWPRRRQAPHALPHSVLRIHGKAPVYLRVSRRRFALVPGRCGCSFAALPIPIDRPRAGKWEAAHRRAP